MRDKLALLGIIQNTLQMIQQLIGMSEKEHDLRIYVGFLDMIHFCITGEQWNDTPKELTNWAMSYVRNELTIIERRS